MESLYLRMFNYSLLLAVLLCVSSCLSSKVSDSSALPNEHVYPVEKVKDHVNIKIDGLIDGVWEKGVYLNDFKDHWNHKKSGLTGFRALWDEDWLYFIYEVVDADIKLEQGYDDSESNAVRSDRVELFLGSQIDDLYYAFEMDADARVFDSKGKFGNYIDETWDMPAEDIQLATSRLDTGYILEGKIALQQLRNLKVLTNDGQLKAGLFRGDYSTQTEDVIWISWGKSNSEKPNFHVPSALNVLMLID